VVTETFFHQTNIEASLSLSAISALSNLVTPILLLESYKKKQVIQKGNIMVYPIKHSKTLNLTKK